MNNVELYHSFDKNDVHVKVEKKIWSQFFAKMSSESALITYVVRNVPFWKLC